MGSVILVDTHVFVLLGTNSSTIRASALRELLDPDNEVYVSAISAFEIAQKVRLGKLSDPGFLPDFDEVLRTMLIKELPLTAADLVVAGSLEWEHRDPFDRMIVAQAQRHELTLVTRDARILESGLVQAMPA